MQTHATAATAPPTRSKLPYCGLEGTLPEELAGLTALKTLDLQHNNLTGGVPDQWTAVGAFPALETLQLAFNSLEGALDDFTPVGSGALGVLAALLPLHPQPVPAWPAGRGACSAAVPPRWCTTCPASLHSSCPRLHRVQVLQRVAQRL